MSRLSADDSVGTFRHDPTGNKQWEVLSKEWFDLVILDQHLGEGVTGTTVAEFIRKRAVNRDAIVVLNTGSMIRSMNPETDDVPYSCLWPKPLPSTEQMRLELCRELLFASSRRNLLSGVDVELVESKQRG